MLSKEQSRPTAEECLNHPWFQSDTLSRTEISFKTLERMKAFTNSINLKRAILFFIAHRSNSREEIQKQRKIFLQIENKKNGYVTYDDIYQLLSPHLDKSTIGKICQSLDLN